jgi:hypothetical protein
LGKAVLWRFSVFSTVMFSSRIDGDPQAGFRLFGRTELPSHTSEEGRWSGPGWFGNRDETSLGDRAISVWDEQAAEIARQIYLFRPVQMNTGTSILIVGFKEPTGEEDRPLTLIADEILDSASRWFWPSINLELQSLEVNAEVYEDGEEVYSEKTGLYPGVKHFVQALVAEDENLVERAAKPGEVAEKGVSFRVPARKSSGDEPEEAEVPSSMNFRLTRAEAEQDGSGLANRIALVRGAGMVVQYRRPTRLPLDEQPFYGVLRAGLAAGDSEPDIAVERFLRAAEPPSHNDWMASDRVQDEYKRGAVTRLKNFWKDLDNAVVELCEEQAPPSGEGPMALSRYFPVGGTGGGGGERPKFRVDQLRASFSDGVWEFSGRVMRRQDGKGAWTFTVFAWLDGETGRGDRLPLEYADAEDVDIMVLEDSVICEVPDTIDEVSFTGKTRRITSEDEMPDLRRTRMRLEVRPKTGASR